MRAWFAAGLLWVLLMFASVWICEIYDGWRSNVDVPKDEARAFLEALDNKAWRAVLGMKGAQE